MENLHPWIDITFPISNGMTTWPGDPPVQLKRMSTIGMEGALANVTTISMSAHTGTHIDAPLHFIRGGKDITQVEPETLIGYTKLFHITDPQQITFSELKELPIEDGDILLFRTRNSEKNWINSPFKEDYVYLSVNAAQYLVKTGVKCIGVDYLSVGGMDNGVQVHKILLSAGITIIEGLKLNDAVQGLYEIVALPMKIQGSDGAPARVVIRRITDSHGADPPA
ncbi:MAG: cyclase family protein [Pedobacter sp.]|nr:MAG: cyclase family protein [Pedobacter sp.]